MTVSQFYWSEFLATDPEVPGSIPAATTFSDIVDLEWDPLSLVRITEELHERKCIFTKKQTKQTP
jgi:hypothetical protein